MSGGVRLGAAIQNAGPIPERLGLAAMARTAEAAGADSVCVSDHLLTVARPTRLPYGSNRDLPAPTRQGILEALSCCAYMAAVTERVRLVTAVLVLPQRNVLELAKTVATIDRLSGGRLVLGIGAGWYEDEMAALGYDFGRRGRRCDEMLEVLSHCWSGRPEPFEGEQVTVPADVVLEPRPLRERGPQLLVGGISGPARRRASRYGDGWIAVEDLATLDLEAQWKQLEAFAERKRERPFHTVMKLHAGGAEADRLPAAVADLAAVGFDEVMVEPPWEDGLEAAAATLTACRARIAGQPAVS